MRVVIFRRAQCLAVLGEEAPKSMVRGRLAFLELFRRNRLGQWVFRCAQSESRTSPVYRRYSAGFVQVATFAGSGCGGRKVRALD